MCIHLLNQYIRLNIEDITKNGQLINIVFAINGNISFIFLKPYNSHNTTTDDAVGTFFRSYSYIRYYVYNLCFNLMCF